MKKITAALAAVIAAGTMLATAGTAQAAGTLSQDMRVEYSVKSSYMLGIPANVILSESDTRTTEIGVRKANIEPGKAVKIAVSGLGANSRVTVANEKDASIKAISTVTDKSGNKLANGSDVASFEGLIENGAYENITFSKIADANGAKSVHAGKYSGTMTFTASIEDK